MNPNIFGESKYTFGDKIRNKIIVCVAVLVVTAVCNTLIMWACTKKSLIICISANIALDIIAAWYAIWQLDRFILPGRKLLRLYKSRDVTINGEVEKISEQTERYYGFDCWSVKVSGHKLFVVNNGTISLQIGQSVSLKAAHGIVKEVLL